MAFSLPSVHPIFFLAPHHFFHDFFFHLDNEIFVWVDNAWSGISLVQLEWESKAR